MAKNLSFIVKTTSLLTTALLLCSCGSIVADYCDVGLKAINHCSFSSRITLGQDGTEIKYTKKNSWTQGMCVCSNSIYLSQCNSSNGNYHIEKINTDGEIIEQSITTFNHANGMAYNKEKNELYICSFDINADDGYDTSNDYSFYVVDPDTYETKAIIDLHKLIINICPDSTGVGGISYSSKNKVFIILTKQPERYVIILNDDFTYNSSFYICKDNGEGIFGDICSTDDYVVTCWWNRGKSNLGLSNVISFFDYSGNSVGDIELFGISHVESIDFLGDNLLASFNDFSENISTIIYEISHSLLFN